MKERSGIQLDIGCGFNKQAGFVGMDKRAVEGVDIVHNIEQIPWPIEDDICLTILCSHILEHTDPHKFFDITNEMYRIARDGCQILIAVPYAGSYGAYQDPTHIHPGYVEAVFAYLDPRPIKGDKNELYQIYKPKPMFQERVNWDPGGNMEAILRVWKDPKKVKEMLKPVKVRKVRVK